MCELFSLFLVCCRARFLNVLWLLSSHKLWDVEADWRSPLPVAVEERRDAPSGPPGVQSHDLCEDFLVELFLEWAQLGPERLDLLDHRHHGLPDRQTRGDQALKVGAHGTRTTVPLRECQPLAEDD